MPLEPALSEVWKVGTGAKDHIKHKDALTTVSGILVILGLSTSM